MSKDRNNRAAPPAPVSGAEPIDLEGRICEHCGEGNAVLTFEDGKFSSNCDMCCADCDYFFVERLNAMIAAQSAPLNEGGKGEGVSWCITMETAHALAAELVRGAQSMGDDESELVLEVRRPGTVAGDDGKLNERPILAISLAEYPEEGVYPIDPANPTGGRVDTAPPASAQGAAPIAYMRPCDGAILHTESREMCDNRRREWTPLYAAPAPSASPAALTDERIQEVLQKLEPAWWDVPQGATEAFARSVLAAVQPSEDKRCLRTQSRCGG